MVFLAKFLSLAICAWGIFILVRPEKVKKVIEFIKEGNRIQWAGVIRMGLGIVLILASPHSRMTVAAIMLGFLLILSGVMIFVVGAEKFKELIVWWESHPPMVFRLIGLAVISFGLLMLYVL